MGAHKTDLFSFDETDISYLNKKGDKFKLVSCPINSIHCHDLLPEINKLYSESELARINKEYQKSIELLQEAYCKTLVLKEPACAKCVELFHSNIAETLETLHKELHEMSSGIFHKKRYQVAYSKLSHFLGKINFLRIGETGNYATKKVSG